MTARGHSQHVEVAPQTLSEWLNRKRDPNLQTLLMLADFFELAGDRLVNAPFEELLGTDLADSDRFRRVEKKIKQHERDPASDRLR